MNLLLIFPGFIVAFIIVLYYERKIRRTEPRNKVHFYVARDVDNSLCIYLGKPSRLEQKFIPTSCGRIMRSENYFLKIWIRCKGLCQSQMGRRTR